jgi:hypothetical protein
MARSRCVVACRVSPTALPVLPAMPLLSCYSAFLLAYLMSVTGSLRQVLVCTSTLAWGVNFPAHLVVIKGTEYFDGKTCRYVDFPVTDVLQVGVQQYLVCPIMGPGTTRNVWCLGDQMIGRAGRPQFDNHGVAVILAHEPKKNFYRKFLYEPFPVESKLMVSQCSCCGMTFCFT